MPDTGWRPTVAELARRSGTIRFRITAIATVVVAVVLVLAGAALVLIQRNQLTSNLDQTLELRADELEALLVRGADLPPNPADDTFAQVVVAGEVVAASRSAVATTPLANAETLVGRARVDDDTFRVLARDVVIDDQAALLVVGEADEDVADSVRALAAALAVAIPLVVVLLGATVWILVGRTLRPVESIRTQVADMDGGDLRLRVPQPPGDDEIARLAATMNAMLDRVEVATERQRQFVSDASHELRSPLTRIRTTLEITNPTDAEELRQTQRELADEVVTLEHLVDDLLHLARSDSSAPPEPMQALDLDDLVFRECRRIRERGRIDIDTHAVSAGCVEGDSRALTRLVRNLLENAERHAASTVTVSLGEADDQVRLSIADDGPGIAPDDAERIFERFTRLDDARTRESGGTGLGLAIVRDIARRHGGDATLDRESPRTGSEFVVRLPSSPDHAPDQAR